MNFEQAQIVIDQLGGNKFTAMTGAKNFIYGPSGLSFKIGRNCYGANTVRIKLEPTDLYTVEFLKVSVKGIKVVSSHNNVYCDQLQELFARKTGMYTHL